MNRGRIFRTKKKKKEKDEKRFEKETFAFDDYNSISRQYFAEWKHIIRGLDTKRRRKRRGKRKKRRRKGDRRRFFAETTIFRRQGRGDRGRQTTARYGSREDRRQNVNRDTGANEPTRRRNVLSLANESAGVTAIHL